MTYIFFLTIDEFCLSLWVGEVVVYGDRDLFWHLCIYIRK